MQGSITRSFDFSQFFRSQLRRCSSLFAYYGEADLVDIDYPLLAEASNRVSMLENSIRYNRPPWSRRHNHAGLLGSADMCGLVDGMAQLLTLGAYFNAGKGASFGQGYHRVDAM